MLFVKATLASLIGGSVSTAQPSQSFSSPPNSGTFNNSNVAPPQQQPVVQQSTSDPQVTINDILRLAFEVAQHARQEDAMGNLKEAFDLYTQALESFLIVYKEEQNAMLKEQLKSTILDYTTRAEQIKAILHPPAPSPNVSGPIPQVTQVKRIVAPGIRNEDRDGPYEQRVKKSHPGHSGIVELYVRVARQKFHLDEKVMLHLEVDNQCQRTVETIKAYLICTTDSYYWKSPDVQDRKHETQKVLDREFTFGKVFPLVHGLRFEGECEYELGPRLKPTERSDPSVLVREYVLVIKCRFKRPFYDLKAFIPLTIKP